MVLPDSPVNPFKFRRIPKANFSNSVSKAEFRLGEFGFWDTKAVGGGALGRRRRVVTRHCRLSHIVSTSKHVGPSTGKARRPWIDKVSLVCGMRRKTENEICRHSTFLSIAAVTLAIADSQMLGLPQMIPRWIKFLLAISFVTAGLNIYDKIASRQESWIYKKCRVPNFVLHLMEIFGGSFAAVTVQMLIRHKQNKSYTRIQYLIIVVQMIMVVVLLLAATATATTARLPFLSFQQILQHASQA
ncbi:hypothetical protein AAMO2058_001378400 [Amorphochlora amoebiformis]